MKNDKFKRVVNDYALTNFTKISGSDDEDLVLTYEKPKRNPKADKERDMRKVSKKDRWDD